MIWRWCWYLVPVVALAGCDARTPANERTDSSVVAKVESVSVAETATVVASAPLTPEGWGPLRIGMSRAEVIAAAGEDANPQAVGGPDPESCDQFRPARMPDGLLVMLEKGRLTRISVARGSSVVTERGFGVGAAASAVVSSYGAKAVVSPHKYQDAPARYITVWSVAPPSTSARGIVYEVNMEGRVSHIHAGSRSITYVEGCL